MSTNDVEIDNDFSKTPQILGVLATQMVIAYEWLSGGWEKLSNAEFVGSMAKTVGYFASSNPHAWYKNFLLGFVASHASTFAYAVELGEFTIGVGLFLAACTELSAIGNAVKREALTVAIIALFFGALMSANFYFAAGWTGPGTAGLNVVMFWIQLVLLYVTVKVRMKHSA